MDLTERAPAKINLGLHVLRQRPDGYHEVETVLHEIGWADAVAAEPASTISMTCSDPTLPTDEGNLCMEAARRLAVAYDVETGAQLHLEKRVPYGAGLGSGSSDAAATLRLLAELWDLDATPRRLQKIGAQIGADVPFFLLDSVAAYATGRGDDLTPLDGATPYRVPFPILIVVPSIRVETAWAYDRVQPRPEDRPFLPDVVRSNDLGRWRRELENDFEPPVTEAEPAIEGVRAHLRRTGAEYVSLSGSGAAVYGVFADARAARRARDEIHSPEVETHLSLPSDST